MPRDDNEERREIAPEGVAPSPGTPDQVAPEGVDPITEAVSGPATEAPPGFNIRRRGYLAAAALGSAASALLGRGSDGGVRFGAMEAFAHDISTFQCTSNDVRIIGVGQIVNEPCTCTGTFNATVQFTVENNASSPRNCITLHLCPVTLPGGGTFDPGDILLQGEIAGKTTQVMTGQINNYPCGAGLLCFGAAIEEGRGRCDASTGCCSTITWGVPGQDTCPPDRLITSKCRHQRICIRGRGFTTLDCDTGTIGVQETCAVTCGSTTTVRLCTTEPEEFGPFLFTVHVPGQPDQTFTGPGPCHDFTVGPITATTTITGDVRSNDGCTKSDSVTLTTTPVATPQLVGTLTTPGCVGSATFTVQNCDPTLTYTFQEVDCGTGAPIGAPQVDTVCPAAATFTFAPGTTDAQHCVRVTAHITGSTSTVCDQTAQASVVVPAAVTATLAVQGTPGCDGVVTLVATASGGVPPYTFTFNGATGVVSGTGNTRTIVIQPQLDGACRRVTVTVTDSRGCSAISNEVSFSQCVVTTTPC